MQYQLGGVKIFKKLFSNFVEEKFADEFDDVEIINGVLIKKENYGKEQGSEKTIHQSGSVLESKKVLREENLKGGKSENETKIYEEIFEKKLEENSYKEDVQNYSEEKIEKNLEEVQVKKGRVKDIEGFYVSLQSAGRSKLTLLNYRYDMNWWQKIAEQKKTSIYNMKLATIEEAISEMDVNTKKRRISALKQLGKWYLREGYTNLNIETQKIILGRGKARIPKAKSEDEFKKIKEDGKRLLGEGKREGIWILLMVICGCRISEIQTVVAGDDAITVIGKGNKERKIPCPEYLLEALKKMEPEGRGGYRKKRQVIDRSLRLLGYSHLHTLRHTYATVLHHNGLNLEEVSKLLGHADISTTQVYAQTKINKGVTKILDEI